MAQRGWQRIAAGDHAFRVQAEDLAVAGILKIVRLDVRGLWWTTTVFSQRSAWRPGRRSVDCQASTMSTGRPDSALLSVASVWSTKSRSSARREMDPRVWTAD
jgi:hypothetical protein